MMQCSMAWLLQCGAYITNGLYKRMMMDGEDGDDCHRDDDDGDGVVVHQHKGVDQMVKIS